MRALAVLLATMPALALAQDGDRARSVEMVFSASRGEACEDIAATLARPVSALRRAQLLSQQGDAAFRRAVEHDAPYPQAVANASTAYRAAEETLREFLRERPRPYTREVGVASWLRIYLLHQLQRDDEAAGAARTLVHECPSCPRAARASVFLGDAALRERDRASATQHYERALRVPRSNASLRSYVHYKIALLSSANATRLAHLLRARQLDRGSMRRHSEPDLADAIVRPLDAATWRTAVARLGLTPEEEMSLERDLADARRR